MSMRVTHEAMVASARRHFVGGITREQAVVLAYAELTQQALDPYAYEDAAILLRAERLLLEGVSVAEALVATAREEFVRWAR